MQTISLEHSIISDLRASIDGRIILPGDPDYDAARATFYGGMDRRPAIIVRAAGAADVSLVVTLARESGLELSVRSGGHSASGYSVSDGGIMLDLSEMRALEIDVEGRSAWVEAGLTAGEYTSAVGEHGLATSFGDSGSVGIGGITVGGGVGFLVRKYGLTIDSLLAADVVTADGELRRADAETNPDLFWAIRGGGGNFGVVTRCRFRLHDVSQFVGGMMILPATPEVVKLFIDEAEAAPEELSTIANVMTAPPMPFLPPEVHGKLVLMALFAFAGPVDAGERAIAPFRALATPLADMVHPSRYAEMYPPEEDDYHPVASALTLFVDALDQDMAEEIISRIKTSTAHMAVAQLRVLGGAAARVPVDATAYAHRNRRIMVNVAALYANPDEKEQHRAWVADFAASLRQGTTGAYVNFLGSEGPERVREAYPGPTWDRLVATKARYDPTNLFRLNQNIPPAVE